MAAPRRGRQGRRLTPAADADCRTRSAERPSYRTPRSFPDAFFHSSLPGHRRGDGQVEAVGAEVVVEQAELAAVPEPGEQFAALLLPDLPQVLRVHRQAEAVLRQPLLEALAVALCDQLLAGG